MSFEAYSGDEVGAWIPSNGQCYKCQSEDIRYRVWESSCGGFEDYHYRCFACGHDWWIDGIDS